MTIEVIEAVRNRKSGKLFIVLDDGGEGRIKVINPNGGIMDLPEDLFEEDAETVAASDFESTFTKEQLDALKAYREQEAAEEKLRREMQAREQPQVASAPAPRRREPSKSSSRLEMGGVVTSWSSSRLTFYKHKIEPLKPRQVFRIEVDGVGTFEIPKSAFIAEFNDVVMNPKYRAEGLFSYPDIPEKALKYRKS